MTLYDAILNTLQYKQLSWAHTYENNMGGGYVLWKWARMKTPQGLNIFFP